MNSLENSLLESLTALATQYKADFQQLSERQNSLEGLANGLATQLKRLEAGLTELDDSNKGFIAELKQLAQLEQVSKEAMNGLGKQLNLQRDSINSLAQSVQALTELLDE